MSQLYADKMQMELQMRAICAGHTSRGDVVQQNLERYREVYARTTQQMNVLKAVSVTSFLAFMQISHLPLLPLRAGSI